MSKTARIHVTDSVFNCENCANTIEYAVELNRLIELEMDGSLG